MKVFISWSGKVSQKVAEILSEWLPMLFQTIIPWMSSRDVKAGARWGIELARNLDDTDFGILCLTSQNISAPWILFEAGALSKSIESGRVIPYLIDMKPNDLPEPLSQFQAVMANKEGTKKLVRAIAEANPSSFRSNHILDNLYSQLWPILKKRLHETILEAKQHEYPKKLNLNEIISLLKGSGLSVKKGTSINLSVYNAELSLYLDIEGKKIPTHRFATAERAAEICELSEHGKSYQSNHWVFEWLDENLITKLKKAFGE